MIIVIMALYVVNRYLTKRRLVTRTVGEVAAT